MRYMFYGANQFAQSLQNWPETPTTSSTSNNVQMFYASTAFRSKYSCPSEDNGPPIKCTCSNAKLCIFDLTFAYSVSSCLREAPVDGNCYYYGTTFTSFGLLSDWDVSRVTNMSFAFKGS